MALAIWNSQYFSMWLQYIKQQCLSYNSNWCRPKVYSLPDINVPNFCFQQKQLIYQLCFGQRHSIKSISYLAWLTTYKLIHFDRNLCKTRPKSVSIKGGGSCLVHSGVRGKRRVSEIDLSQPRYETAFWWRHNGPVTSQLTDPIKWPIYPLKSIGTYVHIDTQQGIPYTRCRRSTNVQLCLIFLYISIWFES